MSLNSTFVCPTEIIAFSDRIEEFKKLDCAVLAASCDSVYSHYAWLVNLFRVLLLTLNSNYSSVFTCLSKEQ